MTTNPTDRLDRIEAILAQVAERQDRLQQQQERLQEQQERTQQQIDSNARAIQANSTEIAELGRRQDATHALLHEEIGNLVTMITTLSDQMQVDRQETILLRTEVRSLIQALRDRFNGNGHG